MYTLITEMYTNRALEEYQMALKSQPLSDCTTFLSVYDDWIARSETFHMYEWRLVRVNRVTDSSVGQYFAVSFALNWKVVFVYKHGSDIHIHRDGKLESLLWQYTSVPGAISWSTTDSRMFISIHWNCKERDTAAPATHDSGRPRTVCIPDLQDKSDCNCIKLHLGVLIHMSDSDMSHWQHVAIADGHCQMESTPFSSHQLLFWLLMSIYIPVSFWYKWTVQQVVNLNVYILVWGPAM
jgi:hypothetical protein